MKTNPDWMTGTVWLTGRVALCATIAAGALPTGAAAADRHVLCEEFTDVWCGGCSYAGPALSRLVDVYPDTFIFVQYHVFDEYVTEWGDARWAYHGGLYTPTAYFDGEPGVEGAVPDYDRQYTIYRTNHFLPGREVPTDITLDLEVIEEEPQSYVAFVTVRLEEDGTAKPVRIYMVQVLDHWPPDHEYHRNAFIQAAPTTDYDLEPGETQIAAAPFYIDGPSWDLRENVKIIAWVQAPGDTGPAPVYQAAQRVWPLVSFPDDDDGDGVPDSADNCPSRYNPEQDDIDEDTIGDVCDNCPFQSNVDQSDLDDDAIGDACDNCPQLHHWNQNDLDGDEVGDVCDSCPDVLAPAGVDPFGRSLGAIDLDCDVDLDDHVLFAACMSGPDSTTMPPECDAGHFAKSDADDDGDVDLDDHRVFGRNFTGPLVSAATYVGHSYCIECHEENHASWSETIHATAFDTLIEDGAGDNELCFPCHSVGYGEPSGFVDLATTPELADIQCENCHGPGSNHVIDPEDVHLNIDMNAELCGACHQSCHGLCGENHHPQYEQWSESKHAVALFDIMWEPDFEDDCMRCHSAAYRLAPEDDKPSVWDANNIDCVACHDPHGSANKGQLRLPAHEMCADCHTMEDAAPGEEPAQDQTEVLHSYGGYELDGTPMTRPVTEHWWGVPTECVQCHVHQEPYGGPDQPVDSGHLFVANMRACEPCHSEESATTLVEMARDEIRTRLAAITPYFDPDSPDYIDPEWLPPSLQAQYYIAKFNYDLVQNDRSYGSHNPGYARAMLDETEAFLGIPPWQPGPPGEP